MRIRAHPSEASVKALLAECELPTEDLTARHMEHFFVPDEPGEFDRPYAVVGLEVFGDVALLRSLAVAQTRRGRGLARELVAHAEAYARERGVGELYLLTRTAEPLFRVLGYVRAERADVPQSIRTTPEFASLCPDSAALMRKSLGR